MSHQTGHTTEVTFSFEDESCFFVACAAILDCKVVGVSAVQRRSGGFLEYMTVHAPAEEVLALAEEHSSVESVRLVDEFDTGCLIEVVVAERCVAASLAEMHAIVTEAVADSGHGTVRAEVTRDADVRRVVERMTEMHPGRNSSRSANSRGRRPRCCRPPACRTRCSPH